MRISINFTANLSYAAKELVLFLNKYTNCDIVKHTKECDQVIELLVDKQMLAHHYNIYGDGKKLTISGGNESSVLCGVYEALADAGILFEATGYSVPHKFDLEAFFNVNKAVKPKFRLRGIRQHINFTMDISSYPLKDAQEYIRSLARMRYNAITFHSYPGQWHETNPLNPKDFAGHFFYGRVHPIPKGDALTASRINNRKYFCIPEVEAIFEDEAKKSEYAKYWLNEVMKTAKEVGMTITLSVEILVDDEEIICNSLHTICKNYPLIDTFELISEECGGFKDIPGLTLEKLPEYMKEHLGKDVFDGKCSIDFLEELPYQLGSAIISLKRVLLALSLREKWLGGLDKVPQLRGGLYLTCTNTLKVLRQVLREKLPAGMTMSLLPAHGASAVADNVIKTGTTAQDWQNTMFYSWAEFDGNMYIQQMETDGICKLASLPDSDSSYGFCINHWRTVENNLPITYCAETAISGMSAKDFYPVYARKIGITNTEKFTEILTKFASLNTYCRDNLFNIGFCSVPNWLSWCRKGDAISPRCVPVEFQSQAIIEYEEVVLGLNELLPFATVKEGIEFLRLMINRCKTSILHIKSLMELDKIVEIYDYDNPKQPSKEEFEQINYIIKNSRSLAEEYLHLYGELLPDRGGEGQLVSYYETTIKFIDAVASNFIRDIVVEEVEDYDAPPMPDESAK